ncbi:MAG: agmatine deiminase family protein [Tepidisphaeraceae bacterium]
MPTLKVLSKSPAELGYTFPAEWEKHAGTWFSWPRPEGISFPGKHHTVPAVMAAIFREIAPRETVHVNVPNENVERIVRQQLKECGFTSKNVRYHHIRTNENWCRDHGPAFVVNRAKKKLAIVDWGFNAWGGKYPPYNDDDAVPTHIAKEFGLPIFYPKTPTGIVTTAGSGPDRVVMEGGAIEVNGAGTLITTTDCLLHKNRNPGLSKAQIEDYLKAYYGQTNILWLTGGIEGDDTDGHVDDLARFISPTKLVMAIEPDPKDVNYKTLKSARKQAEKLRDQDGRSLEIIELPMPRPVTHDGERLPATYVNFSFVNGALLVPTYRDKVNDKKALQILQSHLPKHKVIGIDCHELIWGLGAIHCLSQQMPAV